MYTPYIRLVDAIYIIDRIPMIRAHHAHAHAHACAYTHTQAAEHARAPL